MHIALRVWCAQVRRAVVGHLMLRLAGAWDDRPEAEQQEGSSNGGEAPSEAGSGSGGCGAVCGRGSITGTLHLLRRAMDPTCDLESLILDCAVRAVGLAGWLAV